MNLKEILLMTGRAFARPCFLRDVRCAASGVIILRANPSPRDSHAETVEHVKNYAKAYSTMGGMQMQFNVVSSATMRAAMARPEEYKDLMVRISGYNAYFTQLNRDLQLELVRRADYSM